MGLSQFFQQYGTVVRRKIKWCVTYAIKQISTVSCIARFQRGNFIKLNTIFVLYLKHSIITRSEGGKQGAIRSLYLLSYGLDKKELIVSSAFVAVMIDSTRIPVYAYSNYRYLEENMLLLSLIIGSAILGTVVGNRLVPKVSYELFKKIILIGILIIGVLMVVRVI